MSRKLLIAGGDSFTDKNYQSDYHPELDCSWPKWPEIIAEKLDMDCINLGKSGYGNEYIYSSVLEEVLKQKDKREIGLVMVAWSQCQRMDYQTEFGAWHTRIPHSKGNVFGWVRKSLRYYINLQLLCERYNIPYKQFQMINLFYNWVNDQTKIENDKPRHIKYPGDVEKDREKLKQLVNTYEPYINLDNFIYKERVGTIPGAVADQVIYYPQGEGKVFEDTSKWEPCTEPNDGSVYTGEELCISKWDEHINANGQKKIAEFLYERLKK
mgnify:CR=1 FL=1|tara:strand:- start:133 stop:936 length:804 start_codon:yes stop_codon:yes gene_type:complete